MRKKHTYIFSHWAIEAIKIENLEKSTFLNDPLTIMQMQACWPGRRDIDHEWYVKSGHGSDETAPSALALPSLLELRALCGSGAHKREQGVYIELSVLFLF